MWFWLISSGLLFLVIVTLLPLWRHPAWWVRGWDFPRLQLAALALLLLGLEILLLDRSATSTKIMMGLTAAALIYQGLWIFPYTPLFRREVRRAQPRKADVHLRIMAANVLTPNRRFQDFLQVVRSWKPDVLVTVETDLRWERELEPLRADFPHTLRCPLDNLYGMHLFSRFPLEDPKIQFLVEDGKPSMHTLLRLPGGRRVELHCLHPAPPSPTENETSSERDAELVMVGRAVADSPFPVIVTGDLNDVAWSSTTRLFRKLSGLLDPRKGRGMYNTFHASWPIFRWPVDHIFHSTHFTLLELKRLPPFGSDHFAVGIDLALGEPDAGEQAEEVPEPDGDDFEEAQEKVEAEQVSPREVHCPVRRRART
jgi:endonuclease/exonuclease/phosphatase (EEP) superfamily protein YafD